MTEEIPHTSWSEIDTARQCLMKHHLAYKGDRWRSNRQHPALERGTDWHYLLELLYKTKDPAAPVKQLKRWRFEGKDVELLTWTLNGYFERWGMGDPLWSANVVAVELEILVELPDVGFGRLNLKGIVDLLVMVNGKLWVVDHKSGANPPKRQDLEMLDQWSLYCWALRELGYEVFGSVHNYAKTKQLVRHQTLEERFDRTPIARSDRELEQVAREATVSAWLGKSNNGAPKSPGEQCHRRCGFFEVCLADRRYGPSMAESILEQTHHPREEDE